MARMGRRGGLPIHCSVFVHLMMAMMPGGKKRTSTRQVFLVGLNPAANLVAKLLWCSIPNQPKIRQTFIENKAGEVGQAGWEVNRVVVLHGEVGHP